MIGVMMWRLLIRVIVGFMFSHIVIAFLTYYLLSLIITISVGSQFSNEFSLVLFYGANVFGFLICSLLVAKTKAIESTKLNEHFTVVARNPEITIERERYSYKYYMLRLVVAVYLTFVFCMPLLLIEIVKGLDSDIGLFMHVIAVFEELSSILLLVFFIMVLIVVVVFPQLKRWHWTKHQF